MYKELIDKVSDEHEQYLDYLLLNSRASLIDRSAEIYIKNAITNKLISEAKKTIQRLITGCVKNDADGQHC